MIRSRAEETDFEWGKAVSFILEVKVMVMEDESFSSTVFYYINEVLGELIRQKWWFDKRKVDIK